MNRKDFLMASGALVAGAVFVPGSISNSEIVPINRLDIFKKNSLDLHELERIIMSNILFKDYYPKEMVEWHDYTLENSRFLPSIKNKKDYLFDSSLKGAQAFSQSRLTKKEWLGLRDIFDENYSVIDAHKKNQKLHYIEYLNSVILLKDDGAVYRHISKRHFSTFNVLNLQSQFTKKADASKDETKDEEMIAFFKTLDRLAPEAAFIKKAAELSGLPLDYILARARNESEGREFVLSQIGAFGRLQVNPESNILGDNYIKVISRDNDLTEYILDNAAKGDLLEGLVSNPKLNIAFGVNLMDYEMEKIIYHIVSYYMGIGGVKELPSSIKYKLRNPSRINERDLAGNSKIAHMFRYQSRFLAARNNFKKIRDAIV